MFETPVLLLVFNRPSTTQIVFNKLREIKPVRLFIAADGARPDTLNEDKACAEVKEIVAKVDWPCEVRTLFRSSNLGCKMAVSGAITWFFDQVDEGIILEDDCLPSVSFFSFCKEMLSLYKDDADIFHITSNNYQNGILRGEGSYYFSKYAHIWGWATWKRAWQHYNLELKNWSQFKSSPEFEKICPSIKERKFWTRRFNRYVQNSTINNYWSLQWLYACWYHRGLTITPQKNLTKNIGFGSGTNTRVVMHHLIFEPEDLVSPFKAPIHKEIDQDADAYTFKHIFQYKGTLLSRIKYHLNRILKLKL